MRIGTWNVENRLMTDKHKEWSVTSARRIVVDGLSDHDAYVIDVIET